MSLFRKQQTPELDIETARRILAYAFEVNRAQPNSIPLDVLASYSSYRKERFTLQRTVLVVVMTLFILIPLLFIPPSFTLTQESGADEANPVYRLELNSLMLVDWLKVQIDGHNIPVYEVDSHVYSIEPSRNGQMDVTVTLINRQTATQSVDVTQVDRDSPVIASHWMENGRLYVSLTDDGAGIRYDQIYAVDQNGSDVLPDEIDEEAGYVVFSNPLDLTNIYFPDNADNMLHVIVAIEE